MGAPGFWDDQERAAATSTEHARVQRKLERYEKLIRDYVDVTGDKKKILDTITERLNRAPKPSFVYAVKLD